MTPEAQKLIDEVKTYIVSTRSVTGKQMILKSDLIRIIEELTKWNKELISKMSFDCDETLDFMKESRADNMDLESEREEEIYMYGFDCAMDYFREMIEKLKLED